MDKKEFVWTDTLKIEFADYARRYMETVPISFIIDSFIRSKERIPLFYADEGEAPIYVGQEYWAVILSVKNEPTMVEKYVCEPSDKPTNEALHRIFSSKELANNYLLFNANILSLNDLLSVFPYSNSLHRNDPVFKNFEKLAKKKLNQ